MDNYGMRECSSGGKVTVWGQIVLGVYVKENLRIPIKLEQDKTKKQLSQTRYAQYHTEHRNVIHSMNVYYFYKLLDLEIFWIAEMTFDISPDH